jgi:hypothetical protein
MVRELPGDGVLVTNAEAAGRAKGGPVALWPGEDRPTRSVSEWSPTLYGDCAAFPNELPSSRRNAERQASVGAPGC